MTRDVSDKLRNWTVLTLTIAGTLVAIVMAYASLRADVDRNAASIQTLKEAVRDSCREDNAFRGAVMDRLNALERKQDVILDRIENQTQTRKTQP